MLRDLRRVILRNAKKESERRFRSSSSHNVEKTFVKEGSSAMLKIVSSFSRI